MKRWTFLLLTLLLAASLHAEEDPMGTITVTCTVPSSGWTLEVDEVRRVGDELWVLSRLTAPQGMALTVISTVTASIPVDAPVLPVKQFMTGKTWKWKNDEPITFIKDRADIAAEFDAGVLVYSKAAVPPGSGTGTDKDVL
jgi:hypothetical protein